MDLDFLPPNLGVFILGQGLNVVLGGLKRAVAA